jgi:hypothetical protein
MINTNTIIGNYGDSSLVMTKTVDNSLVKITLKMTAV